MGRPDATAPEERAPGRTAIERLFEGEADPALPDAEQPATPPPTREDGDA